MEYKKVFTGEASEQQIKICAYLKRALEYWTMEPGFQEKFKLEPEKTLEEYGLSEVVDVPSIKALAVLEEALLVNKNPQLMPVGAKLYRSFCEEKIAHREYLITEGCVPTDASFSAWRKRQLNRCWIQLGAHNNSIIHTPVNFELSLGCSVGCPFCGVAAKRLEKVARYDEIGDLWKKLLSFMKDTFGVKAASSGTCYYASEPLDNPDYERFADDFYEVMGDVPQITTAVAMRNPARIKEYLSHAEKQHKHIHRFSVLSLDIFHKIMSYFTPEELLLVELLPQFVEAPNAMFSKVGRAAEDFSHQEKLLDESGATIACISGFITNIAEKSIRLITPCGANEKYPTGEIIIDKVYFSDFEDYKEKITTLTKKYIIKDISKTYILKFRPEIFVEYNTEKVTFFADKRNKIHFSATSDIPFDLYKKVTELILKGSLTGREIVEILFDEGIMPAKAFYLLKRFTDAGLCLEPYEVNENA